MIGWLLPCDNDSLPKSRIAAFFLDSAMHDFRYYLDILTEAQYDSLADAIRREFPDQLDLINSHVTWAKTYLKKADRVTWYLKILRLFLGNSIDKSVTGEYQFESMERLQQDLVHYYGFDYPPINNYQYTNQPIGDLISHLSNLENQWKTLQIKSKGIVPKPDDYRLFEFTDGTAWWFVNRAYCSDEATSGQHCGNVAGQTKTAQRILSLRTAQNQVILTFILEPENTLGEMKAKGNLKPDERYHPHIMKLLFWDRITGITGEGYLPDMNFNIFDLSEENLKIVDQYKPQLIATQIKITPFSLLTAPRWAIDKYGNLVSNNRKIAYNSAIPGLLNDPSMENWKAAVEEDDSLIIYAPRALPDYENILVNYFSSLGGSKGPEILLRCRKEVLKDYDLLAKIIEVNPFVIKSVQPTTRGYTDLCNIAIEAQPLVIEFIPDEHLTYEMCENAVVSNASAMRFVPLKLEGFEDLALMVIDHTPYNRQYIHPKGRTYNVYKRLVEVGGSLNLVPEKFLTVEICEIAAEQDVFNLEYVPDNLLTYSFAKKMMAKSGNAMSYVMRDTFSDKEKHNLAKIAIENDWTNLNQTPLSLLDKELIAVARRSGFRDQHKPYLVPFVEKRVQEIESQDDKEGKLIANEELARILRLSKS